MIKVRINFKKIKKLPKTTLILLGLLFLALNFLNSNSLVLENQLQAQDSVKVELVKVIDGDTLKVRHGNELMTVRLIGIDTPETKPNIQSARQAKRNQQDQAIILKLGQKALHFVQTLCDTNPVVSLEFDQERLDRFGRTLAYVYLADGRMLNQVIIESGYAYPMTIAPNLRYSQQFLSAFEKARANNLGLWRN